VRCASPAHLPADDEPLFREAFIPRGLSNVSGMRESGVVYSVAQAVWDSLWFWGPRRTLHGRLNGL
jgi:hypothetical protein